MAVRTVFANESGNQPASQLDAMYSDLWNAATIPCTVTGTNAITLTPRTNANQPTSYVPNQRVAFTAGNTSTGSVTAQLGSLAALNVYLPGGLQAGANDINATRYYELAYDANLNSGGGGWWVVVNTRTPVMQLLNTLTASNSATLSDTTSLTSAFNAYDLVFTNLVPATGNTTLELQVHSGGAFKTTGYLGATNTTGSGSSSVANATTFIQCSQASTCQTGDGVCGTIRVYGPSLTSGAVKWAGNFVHANGVVFVSVTTAGAWNTSGAIDGFQVLFSSGNITSGTIKIYGIL